MIKIGKIKIETYDGMDDMPADKFHQFNAFILIEAQVGSDLDSFGKHLAKMKRFAKDGDIDNHGKECDLLYHSVSLAMQRVSPLMNAFIPMIKTWNGEPFDFVPNDRCDHYVSILSKEGATVGFFKRLVNAFKKKVDEQMGLYFPKLSSRGSSMLFSQLKRMAMALLDEVIRDNDQSRVIDEIDRYLLSLNEPKVFHGPNGLDVQLTLNFHKMCISLKPHLNENPRKAPATMFFTAVTLLKEKIQKESANKLSKKGKR